MAGSCERGNEPSGSKKFGEFVKQLSQYQAVICFLLGDSPASDYICRRFGTLYLFHLQRFEDGTDRVFRNVGIYKSEAGESPKRKQTTF